MAESDLKAAAGIAERIAANIAQVIVGKGPEVEAMVLGLLSSGHVLLEGPSGVGKTMFARSLARSVDIDFRRIQCTSDLLPSDVTGAYVFDQRDADFHFRSGPIMANLVLVDEINRASPRTQSAFLECMEEQQVTVDGVAHALPAPFLLIATRNPEHHGGTFPLPETELDRFHLRIFLDMPSASEEAAIVERQLGGHPIADLQPVAGPADVQAAQAALKEIYVDRQVIDYAVALVGATRKHPSITAGASPRATIALVSLARANALLRGRAYAVPDDVKAVALGALGHRLMLGSREADAATVEEIVDDILGSVPVETPA